MSTKKSLYGVRIYELKNVIFMMPNHIGVINLHFPSVVIFMAFFLPEQKVTLSYGISNHHAYMQQQQ